VSSAVACISFNVELEIEYDSFKGKTLKQFTESVEDDLHSLIAELRPDDVSCFITSTKDVRLLEQ
jgi:hypothetical protein|tara:strand:+ start:1376 stop:1570 length:195 start_codon:yes stop_codon:yes gene_type:complete